MATDATSPKWERLTEQFESANCMICGGRDPVQGIRTCPECGEILTASTTANLVRVFHDHLGDAHPEVAYKY